MESQALFVVSSPLQLMNAIEAVHHFKVQEPILLILYVDNPRTQEQMQKLKSMIPWHGSYSLALPQTLKGRLGFALAVKRLKKEMNLPSLRYIFVGDYEGDHMNHVVNSFDAKEVYLVDDGMVVSFYQKHQHKKKSFKVRIRHLLYRLLGYKLALIKYRFFTIYEFKDAPVVRNEYRFFKSYIDKKEQIKALYFVGQPLVELGIVSMSDYKELLESIATHYRDQKRIYVGHRAQDRAVMEPIVEDLGFVYQEFSNPLELEMIFAEKVPSDFATFYSTALMTLPYFVTEASYCLFEIPQEMIASSFQERIALAYRALSSSGLPSIKL